MTVRSEDEPEFRIRPKAPPTGRRAEAAVWSLAFKRLMHYARLSRTARGGRRSAPPARRTFSQRCAVRVIYTKNKTSGQWRAHGRYIERESAATDRENKTQGFNATEDAVPIARTLDEWQTAGDKRLFKLIISPEFGERVDLRRLTRELLGRMEEDVRTVLEWIAVMHFNTEHPHVHVALRGRRSNGDSLELDREYIKAGIRQIAEALCTQQLGYRSELDALESQRRAIHAQRYTPLDRLIDSRDRSHEQQDSTHFVVLSQPGASDLFGGGAAQERLLEARLVALGQMGLAERAQDPGYWRVRRDFAAVLRAMQVANDHQRILAANGAMLSDERLPMVTTDPRRIQLLEGRVLLHAEEDHGRYVGFAYLLLEGTDARVHVIYHTPEIQRKRGRGQLRPNSFARLETVFTDGVPSLRIEDLGDADSLLTNREYFHAKAARLLEKDITPTENGWAGWLGRYQSALTDATRDFAAERQRDRN